MTRSLYLLGLIAGLVAAQSAFATQPYREEVFRPGNATAGDIWKVERDCYSSIERTLSATASLLIQRDVVVYYDGHEFKAVVYLPIPGDFSPVPGCPSRNVADVSVLSGANFYEFPSLKLEIPESCRTDALGRYATDPRCKINKVTLETDNNNGTRIVQLMNESSGSLKPSELSVDALSLIQCMRDGLNKL